MTTPRVNPGTHRWEFKARFRRHGFGWRSQPAAYSNAMKAAHNNGTIAETRERVSCLIAKESAGGLVTTVLGRGLGL